MATIVHAVGARPNFIKMAPVIDALQGLAGLRQLVVHTGQHYDQKMSDDVIADLPLPPVDRSLDVGSGRHGEQTAKVLARFEEVLVEETPDLVVVAGDVNSTFACALAAVKLMIPVAHVESGLRSHDWRMPEEVNRVLTDRVSSLLFTHSPEAEENLAREGIDRARVRYVGNTMIDSLRRTEGAARARAAWEDYGFDERSYVLVTLHRPATVDDPQRLPQVAAALCELAGRHPVVFPIHPRTRKRLEATGALAALASAGVFCLDPLGYLDFLSLECGAGAVLTDSGGIQEETSALGVKCFTFRPNTERPITIELGTNELIGDDPARISLVRVDAEVRPAPEIPLWDGHAGERTADAIAAALDAGIPPL